MMFFFTTAMLARWYQRMTGTPSGLTRNFSKFHLMSWIRRGSQKSLLGFPKSSTTGGQAFCNGEPMHHCLAPPKSKLGLSPSPLAVAPTFRKVKIFCSLAPFTSPFWNSWKLGTKPPPGRTYLQGGEQDVVQWTVLDVCTGVVTGPQTHCLGPEPAAAAAWAPTAGGEVSYSPHHSTHLSAGRISEFWPGSCFPNWLEGKPRTTSPSSLSSSCSAFSSACKESQKWVNRGLGTPPHLWLPSGTILVRLGPGEQALTLSPAPQSRLDRGALPCP